MLSLARSLVTLLQTQTSPARHNSSPTKRHSPTALNKASTKQSRPQFYTALTQSLGNPRKPLCPSSFSASKTPPFCPQFIRRATTNKPRSELVANVMKMMTLKRLKSLNQKGLLGLKSVNFSLITLDPLKRWSYPRKEKFLSYRCLLAYPFSFFYSILWRTCVYSVLDVLVWKIQIFFFSEFLWFTYQEDYFFVEF